MISRHDWLVMWTTMMWSYDMWLYKIINDKYTQTKCPIWMATFQIDFNKGQGREGGSYLTIFTLELM